MIRTFFAVLFVVLFFILSLPVLLVFKLLYKRCPSKIDAYSLAIIQWAFRTVAWIAGIKVLVYGEEQIPADVPVLYTGNHCSIFDIVLTYPRVKGLTGYISKMSVKKIPVLGLWMNRVHCLFLDRKDIKQGLKIILEAIEKVKNGISIFIFPEGTRSRTPGEILEFKEGSFKIATKTGCPIIPVTIVNTQDIFETHMPWIKKKTVIIEYGAPIYIEELDKETQKHIGAYVQNIVSETYRKHYNA